MAKCADLVLYQGDDWAAMICVNNSDGTAADLTGYTAQAQIRDGIADQAWRVVARLLCAIVLPNGISISLTHRQTTRLRQPAYCWDLQIVSPGGIISTILAGRVRVTFEVTRHRKVPEELLLEELLVLGEPGVRRLEDRELLVWSAFEDPLGWAIEEER